MKNFVTLCSLALLFLSCAQDGIEKNSNANLLLNDFEPKAQFEAQSQGVYIGSVISSDLNYHGKVKVNAGNNGLFAAQVKFENEVFNFVSNSNSLNELLFEDSKNASSFILDITDYQNPTITNFQINGVSAHMVLQKDDANNRADVLIGNYADVNDASFFGTFDVFTIGAPHPYSPAASLVSRTAFVTPGGGLFVDETMETFDFSLCSGDLAQTDFVPLMFVQADGSDAHFYADNQTSTVGGLELTWQIFKENNGGYFIQFKDLPGFEDGCYPTASGIWGWNGRYGVLQFDFNVPNTVSENVSTTPNGLNDEADEVSLTSEMIEDILQ